MYPINAYHSIPPYMPSCIDDSINARDEEGVTKLMRAAESGNMDEVESLLQARADPEVRDKNGIMTALIVAAFAGQWKVMQRLKDANADIECAKDGVTALMIAVIAGQGKAVQLLLNARANIEACDHDNHRALMHGATNGQEEAVRVLIASRANLEARDTEGRTALALAAMLGNESIVRALAEARANLEVCDHKGDAPLLSAVILNKTKAVQALIEARANIEVSQDGRRVLTWARNRKIAKMLIKAHADIEACDDYGRTPLIWAVINGNKKVVQELIEARAQVDTYDHGRRTAFMSAVKLQQGEAVRALMQARANTQTRDIDGCTALVYAMSQPKINMLNLLDELGLEEGWGYAGEFLRRKLLAHAWGIPGQSQYVDEMNSVIEFGLEGADASYIMQVLSRYVRDFFASNEKGINEIPQPFRENISTSIANSFLSSLSNNLAEILARIESGAPIVISGGFERHAIVMIMSKTYINHYTLTVCNRGAGRTANTSEFYFLYESNVSAELISKLREKYSDGFSFNQMIQQICIKFNLIHIGGFNQKKQEVGNCPWANGKAALKILLEGYFGKIFGTILYKQFTRFAREKALKESLMRPLCLDRYLLQEVEKKYINEKPNIFLSEEVLEKLELTLQALR